MRTITVLSLVAGSAASYPPILGYYPSSKVTDHNRIDLDQAALEGAFATCGTTEGSTCTGMSVVKAIYEDGGNSGPQGVCTIDSTSTPATIAAGKIFAKKNVLAYKNNGGTDVPSKASAAGASGGTTISFYYATSSEREHEADACVVGGTAPASEPTKCMDTNAEITVTDDAGGQTTYTCSAVDNTKAARTLQGFSTKAKKLMYDPALGGCPAEKTAKSYKNGCPYTSFTPYYKYYCDDSSSSCNANGAYADEIILKAIASGKTNLANGDVDFTKATGEQLKEVIKKAAAYMNSWMYAIREFEDAIDDCTGGTLTNNDLSSGSVHAWDEGVAFYTGSILETGHLSGATGATTGLDALNAGVGKQAYDLGNKRCRNFATCGPHGGLTTGQSQQNYELFKLFNEGQIDFRVGNCGGVVPVKDKIVQWMTVPLVQGTLRYAYESGVANGVAKGRAEGAIFALAVLPQVHACSPTAATTIHTNVVANMVSGAIDFNAVKAAFEGCYATMFPDIAAPCAAIGTYGGGTGVLDYTGTANTATCTDPSATASSDDLSSGAIAGIAIGAGVAGVALLGLLYVICKERAGKPLFTPVTPAKGTSA